MNLPNKLTILRIIFVPLMVFVLLCDILPYNFLISGLIFGLASLTDYYDGKIARKYNLITDFGKFADPIADKILVVSALACFVEMQLISSVALILILFREFAVTSVRLVAVENGKVVAANYWGKLKTVSQMIAIIFVFLSGFVIELSYSFSFYTDTLNYILYIISNILVWISVILTIISGVIYIKDNFEYIKNVK